MCIYFQMMTDVIFGVYWDRQLKDHSQVAPSYGYVLDRVSDLSNYDEWLGSYGLVMI